MKRNKIAGYFLFISVFSLITIFIFLVQKSYDNLMGPIIGVKSNNLTKPIDPNLDTATIDMVEQKKEYSLDTFSISIPEPSPTPAP